MNRMNFAFLLLAAVLFVAFLPRTVDGGDEPLVARRLVQGLDHPIYACAPPGDYERLFVAEQQGVIKVIDLVTREILPTPFLDIDSITGGSGSGGDERGLLGMAFHPDYENNGYFYTFRTNNSGTSVLRRYTVSATDPNVADPASGFNIFTQSQPFENHNGGWIGFGPLDGYLYVAFGDGGAGNDPGERAQDITNQWLGKMLRIDVDGGSPYAVPSDNPFVGITGDDEIWAFGLRNPWRCGFDSLTGDLYIGDVGQNAREEVSFQEGSSPGGENYGWDCREGNNCITGDVGCGCNDPDLVPPIHDYVQTGNGCTVVGGYVYRGVAMSNMQGIYFFGDYCSSNIWSFVEDNGTVTQFQNRTNELEPPGGATIGGFALASFAEDALGEIYIVDRGSTPTNGEIYKIVSANMIDCNLNRIDDAIEIAFGIAEDCNNNGIPDDCDIDSGTSSDTNDDGIPDECQDPGFVRGDCNNDGMLDLTDATTLLDHLFGGGGPVDCPDACDIDDSGGPLALVHAINTLNYLFLMGDPPAPPFPDCGPDPTDADGLTCDGYDPGNCP